MNTIPSQQIHARISGFAAGILQNHQQTLGIPGQPASQAQVLELALGLLELSNAPDKINRARTLLWTQLVRDVASINIQSLQTQMARHKNKRGRARRITAPQLILT